MNPEKRKNLLLFSLAAETFFASYGLLLGNDAAVVSILYLLAGLVFIFAMLIMPAARLPSFSELKRGSAVKWPLWIIMAMLAFITSRYWLEKIPLDPDFADMLPVMKVMNERFLRGEWKQVYDPVSEIWNGTKPIYLPAMWLPYAPAILLKIDMRWITMAAVLASFSIILLLIRIKKNKYFGIVLIAVSGILFWWIFSRNDIHGLISMSEEGVVILYFVMLTLAVISGNPVWMGITASLCLLSRYSMIGWLIPCLIFLVARGNKRNLIVFSVTGILCFLLLFLFPFGYKILEQMIALPANYVAFAKHVWEFSPEVYWLNLGIGKFYGPHKMAMLHTSLLFLSFIIPVLFMVFCLLQKKWKPRNINLACLKLSLLVFYQFIDVPYGYLFYTCSFVSLVFGAVILRERESVRV
jgi:hypothetical protein